MQKISYLHLSLTHTYILSPSPHPGPDPNPALRRYVAGRFETALTVAERQQFADPDITWPQIQALVDKEKAAGLSPNAAYGLS